MAGITQKTSVAAFSLWSLQKQNSWVQKSENNIKDIVGILIFVYWQYTREDLGIGKKRGIFFPVY